MLQPIAFLEHMCYNNFATISSAHAPAVGRRHVRTPLSPFPPREGGKLRHPHIGGLPMTRAALDRVLARLDGARKTPRGYQARCPAHADHRPSLSVRAG